MNERALAEQMRDACVAVLSAAWEEAGILGLCGEGRWEYALDVLKGQPVEALLSGKET